MDAVEARTIAKVSKRLVPFLIVCYFVAYLDRVNVSFAALTMNQDLGLSQTGFGVAERRFHAAFPLFVAAAGIAVSTTLGDPTLKMLSLCVAGFGIFACLPVFWTLPTAFLSGAACAAGVAVINSIGNLAGFAGPFAMGWIKDQTGSYAGGLLLLAALGIVAMGIALALGHDQATQRAPVAAE